MLLVAVLVVLVALVAAFVVFAWLVLRELRRRPDDRVVLMPERRVDPPRPRIEALIEASHGVDTSRRATIERGKQRAAERGSGIALVRDDHDAPLIPEPGPERFES